MRVSRPALAAIAFVAFALLGSTHQAPASGNESGGRLPITRVDMSNLTVSGYSDTEAPCIDSEFCFDGATQGVECVADSGCSASQFHRAHGRAVVSLGQDETALQVVGAATAFATAFNATGIAQGYGEAGPLDLIVGGAPSIPFVRVNGLVRFDGRAISAGANGFGHFHVGGTALTATTTGTGWTIAGTIEDSVDGVRVVNDVFGSVEIDVQYEFSWIARPGDLIEVLTRADTEVTQTTTAQTRVWFRLQAERVAVDTK